MPTRRGWEVLLGGLVVVLMGRILGLVELYVVGIAGVILLGACVAWVRLSPVRLEATRRLRPQRVPVGGSVAVELSITNVSTHRSPLLEVRDPFEADSGAAEPRGRMLMASVRPGETGRTTYQLVAGRRGVFGVGPLEAEVRDPFGLAASRSKLGKAVSLTVLPRVVAIPPPPRSASGRSSGGTPRPPLVGSSGEDFYALREYAPGDDVRQIHWASTARRNQMMVRQNEHPVQDRTIVLLDLRAQDIELFEAAISAAASVISAAAATLVRLVDTSGHDSGYGSGPAHTGAILDRLAAVRAVGSVPLGAPGGAPDGMARALTVLQAAPGGGTVIIVTSAGDATATALGDQTRLLGGLGLRFAPIVVVAFGVLQGDGRQRGAAKRVQVIGVAAGQDFESIWRQALVRGGRAADGLRIAEPSRGPGT